MRVTDGESAAVSYRVVVKGRLSEHVAAAFEGVECEPGAGESVLTGALDQAGLHGLLERLRDLGVQLVSVNPIDCGRAPE